MSRRQTDNTYFWDKVQMRIKHLPASDPLNVLDVFGGDGLIWNEVIRHTGRNINVTRIDRKRDKRGVYLRGENVKFLAGMNLDLYQIIDLDAYGIPYQQLKVVFDYHRRSGQQLHIFVTSITVGHGRMHNGLLRALGYTAGMIKKIPTLFNRNSQEKIKQFLAQRGVKKIHYRYVHDAGNSHKMYIFFKLQ